MLLVSECVASFQGNLDITTLGGAGFASQRTRDDELHLDLSKYEALELVLDVSKTDDKKYTFILKDEVLPSNPDNGREQSTVSWEYNFVRSEASSTNDAESPDRSIIIPFTAFKAMYRGRPDNDAESLRVQDIRRFSIMIRR